MVAAAVMLPLVAALALLALASAEESTTTVTLGPGYTSVTWSGAEPYAIANFEGTPVTQIHRRDPVRQKWLSHAVGQDEATLPELHLLPRVQYLLKSDAAHELTIPNPLTDIDPLTKLRFPPIPGNPLRFDAYWPNEDSPLEDLVVLRGEDERLSVKAWIAGGEGDVSVWWVIDGRVNHAGLESDDVDLVPGRYDHGRLYAADGMGQIAVVELPRVVRLPSLESLDLPEWQAGIDVYLNYVLFQWDLDLGSARCADWMHLCTYNDNLEAGLTAIDWVAEAGFSIVRIENFDWDIFAFPPGAQSVEALAKVDRMMAQIAQRGLDVLTQNWIMATWARASMPNGESIGGPPTDPLHFAEYVGSMAERYPQIRYWQMINEPDLRNFYQSMDPVSVAQTVRAGALAVWHANPNAVIVGPGFSQVWVRDAGSTHGLESLQEMLDAGLARYVDVYDLHLYLDHTCTDADMRHLAGKIDDFRAVLQANGEGHKQFWSTEMGTYAAGRIDQAVQAHCTVKELDWLEQRSDVNAAFVHSFLSGGGKLGSGGIVDAPFVDGAFTPREAYWALREFLTGQPPPEE